MSTPFVLVAAMAIVLLHRIDGGEVAIVPSHVTSLHGKPATGERNKLVPPEARCVVWLDDGKLLAVIEPCDAVKKLLEQAMEK